MALAIKDGHIKPEYPMDSLIFADTGAEPKVVYRWLDWLEKQLPWPVYRVSRGNIMKDQLTWSYAKDGTKYVRNVVPAFTVNQDGTTGMLLRKCTADYKLAPIRRKVRELMKEKGEKKVTQLIGISLDEAHRMKPSGVKFIENTYPLVDQNISRWDCLKWMKDNHGEDRIPPKSACTICPYHNNQQWKSLEPEELSEVAAFEKTWNEMAVGDTRKSQVRGLIRLHRSGVSIDQADFSSKHDGQMDMFGDECEGMCGL